MTQKNQPKIEVISATRLSKEEFGKRSALGISLRRLGNDPRLVSRIFCANRQGLPGIFNKRIQSDDDRDILVFIHDDVWIDDYFFFDRIVEGLERFDVIGLAGNRRRVPNQPNWAFIDQKFTWDEKRNLSGSVAHGKRPFGGVNVFGPTPAACELIDGVLMATKKATLKANNITFDRRFDFHFYDMDFCRSVRQKGLSIGTWPICITHQSGGNFASQQWLKMYESYMEKWGS